MNAIVPTTQTSLVPSAPDAFLQMIERASRDPAIDLTKLQHLLDMRAQEYARIAALRYSEAMSVCQAAMEPIRADCANEQTRSRYASLAALDAAARPIYTQHGFCLTFDTDDSPKEEHIRIVCDVLHAGGHVRRHHIDMPADGKGPKGVAVMTRTHAAGSAVTYGRRQLIGMVFNLTVEKDDDGNAAGRRHASPARPTPGKHANGDDNRFYREPAHDPQTGEITERASELDESEIIAGHDADLAKAAAHGMAALAAAWKKVPPRYQHALKSALDRRHKAAATQANNGKAA